MKQTPAKTAIIALIILAVAVYALNLLLTGRPFAKRIVERLNSPLHVKQICPDGFVLDDGKLIRAKYVEELPADSAIIRDAVAQRRA